MAGRGANIWRAGLPRSQTDDWLQQTTAGLLATSGWSLLRAPSGRAGLAQARRTGLGTAATLLAIDLVYVP
ncbi:hypothetical protein J7F01_18620 [Streptomyces sp. ISL-22]|uniref:hypothetical protein n=1 Tax=unclassified Streptomyces TaxID=2593676 RepID=UPI001BECA4F9|nr:MULTISPECIES: hypothetical protein [unclassified Streptomyces]MBT2416356.1 hypothetical protein [Streptomyces sp. ISL-24]MBT2434155.1 hypothetical protein [Streptomyces sp. ISL-22]